MLSFTVAAKGSTDQYLGSAGTTSMWLSSTSAGLGPPLSRAQMLPRPGAEEAVSNWMPSAVKMSAKNFIVAASLPGGLVVLMRMYWVRCARASDWSAGMSVGRWAAAGTAIAASRNRVVIRSDRQALGLLMAVMGAKIPGPTIRRERRCSRAVIPRSAPPVI